MHYLSLNIPNFGTSSQGLANPPPINILNFPGFQIGPNAAIKDPSLAGILSAILSLVFSIAGILLFVFLLWGVVQYILAGGQKERMAKAKARITYALIGFVVVVIAFSLSNFLQSIFFPAGVPTILTPISRPDNPLLKGTPSCGGDRTFNPQTGRCE